MPPAKHAMLAVTPSKQPVVEAPRATPAGTVNGTRLTGRSRGEGGEEGDGQARSAPGPGDVEDQTTTSPYGQLAEDTRRYLEAMGGADFQVRPRALPPHLHEKDSRNGRFQLQGWAWLLGPDSSPPVEFRLVLIEGARTSIINAWGFPWHASRTPVFAAELIAVGGAPRLTFMDIQGPGLRDAVACRARRTAGEVRLQFPRLRIAEQPPSWAVEASFGEYLFARQGGESDFPCISRAYRLLLAGYLRDLSANASAGCSQPTNEERDRLRGYQLHHMESSPGKKFLGKVFGEEWTSTFLTQFLFSLPGEQK
jgi:hypothetical protein